jgi:hypothetical protein
LDLVRKSTELHCSEWPVLLKAGGGEMRKFRDQWAVAYGRLEFRNGLQPPVGEAGTLSFRWGNGYGHLGQGTSTAGGYVGKDAFYRLT